MLNQKQYDKWCKMWCFTQQNAVSFWGLRPRPPFTSNHKWKETNEACSKCCALSIIRLYVLCRQLQGISPLSPLIPKGCAWSKLVRSGKKRERMVKNVMLKGEIVVSFWDFTSRHPRRLHLELIRNEGKQMKTCAKCCISRCNRHMYYGVRFWPDFVPIPFPKSGRSLTPSLHILLHLEIQHFAQVFICFPPFLISSRCIRLGCLEVKPPEADNNFTF